MNASDLFSGETADKLSGPAADHMSVSDDEAEDETAQKLSSLPEHPRLARLRHRRLMALLSDQGFHDSFDEVMEKTRAHMSVSHLCCLVERGQWEDAVEYVERYLPPETPSRPWSLQAQVLHHFLVTHQRFANAVDGTVDSFVPRNYFHHSNARAVSHAQLRLRSICFSILAVHEVRANMNWQAVRNRASFVLYRLARSTPELRDCIDLPATSIKPHNVLPVASGLRSPRRYVKRKNTGRSKQKAIIRALKSQRPMVPKLGSLEEAKEFLADLLDETIRYGVQLVTYGPCRPVQTGMTEGALYQPLLESLRASETYGTLANAGTNKLQAEPGSHTNTARQDLDGRKNSREELATAEEGHGPKRQRSTGAFGEASLGVSGPGAVVNLDAKLSAVSSGEKTAGP